MVRVIHKLRHSNKIQVRSAVDRLNYSELSNQSDSADVGVDLEVLRVSDNDFDTFDAIRPTDGRSIGRIIRNFQIEAIQPMLVSIWGFEGLWWRFRHFRLDPTHESAIDRPNYLERSNQSDSVDVGVNLEVLRVSDHDFDTFDSIQPTDRRSIGRIIRRFQIREIQLMLVSIWGFCGSLMTI